MTLVTIPLLLEAGCIWCTDASTTTVTDDDDEHFPITTSSKSMNPTPIQGIVLSNPELKIRKKSQISYYSLLSQQSGLMSNECCHNVCTEKC